MPLSSTRRLITVLLLVSFATFSVPAQDTKRTPDEKPRKIKQTENGKELYKHLEDWREINDAGQRLTLARLIDSRTLEPGEYQVQIRIRDHITGQTTTPSAMFTIVP